jgi:hypothetical protein
MSTSFTSTTLDPASPYADTMYVMVTPTGAPLEAVVAEAKQSYGTILPGYRVITDQPIQLSGGQPAHLLSGTFRTLRVGRQILQLVTVHSGKAYAVTFMAAGSFGDMQSPFQKSVSSFALE